MARNIDILKDEIRTCDRFTEEIASRKEFLEWRLKNETVDDTLDYEGFLSWLDTWCHSMLCEEVDSKIILRNIEKLRNHENFEQVTSIDIGKEIAIRG